MLQQHRQVLLDPFDLGTRFVGDLSSDPAIRAHQDGGMRLVLPAGLDDGDLILHDTWHGLPFDPALHEVMDGLGHLIP